MRKSFCVGILRETKQGERRAPLVPDDVNWLLQKGIKVEVESSPQRIFKDNTYRASGAKVIKRIKEADVVLGIKEPCLDLLHPAKIYMFFSHTIKGQAENMSLLAGCLKKKITLIDYERIVDAEGRRLVYFGRFAGICGLVDSLYYFGQKMKKRGIKKQPFSLLSPCYRYGSLKEIKQAISKVLHYIQSKGFDKRLAPFIIGITGHGHVSQGVQEILELFNPQELYPRDMLESIRHEKGINKKIFKIVFLREEKIRLKTGKGFYFEEYLDHPERFESNLDLYLPYLNILVHTSYWDKRFPRIVTKRMINRLSKKKPFRLEFIADISCDINGSIELTYKPTTSANPTFTYEPEKRAFSDGTKGKGITILAIDNLPSELPRDASIEFGGILRDYVYQLAVHGVKDVSNHVALPSEIRRAVITQGGRLRKDFSYLKKFLKSQ